MPRSTQPAVAGTNYPTTQGGYGLQATQTGMQAGYQAIGVYQPNYLQPSQQQVYQYAMSPCQMGAYQAMYQQQQQPLQANSYMYQQQVTQHYNPSMYQGAPYGYPSATAGAYGNGAPYSNGGTAQSSGVYGQHVSEQNTASEYYQNTGAAAPASAPSGQQHSAMQNSQLTSRLSVAVSYPTTGR
jgi:hypothetical protein